MILLTGAINDRNKETVYNKTVLVWIDPTANMDRPMVNEFRNRFFELLGETNDDCSLVIWSNDSEIIDTLCNSFSELWRVEDGILSIMTKEEFEKDDKNYDLKLSEMVTRNWIFS
jgi:hypothetical protein